MPGRGGEEIVLAHDDVAVRRSALAGSHIAVAVHLDETVVADADAAEDPARPCLRRRPAESELTGGEDHARQALPDDPGDRLPIDRDRHGGGGLGLDRILTERE